MSQTENFPTAASIEEAAARYFDDDIHAAYEEQEGRVHVGVGRLLLQRRLPNGATEQYRADAVEAYVLDSHGQSAGYVIEPLPDQWDADDAARVMADALARVRGGDLLAAVRRSVGDVEAAEAALVRARAGRDSLLRAAHSGGVSAKALGEATGWVGSKRSRLHQVLGQE